MGRFWLAALLVAASLAGCSGTPVEDRVGQGQEPCLVERADDFTCLDAELNGTATSRPHLHDYWGTRDRIVLEDMSSAVGGTFCTGPDPYAYPNVLVPADGDVIVQGTSQVEVTMTFPAQQETGAVMSGDLYLFVKTAADVWPQNLGRAESGKTVVLDTTNAMNDLPHQVLSAWTFGLGMGATNPTNCHDYTADVTAHVEIVRGLDIPLFEGHPDLWQDATELPMLDEVAEVELYYDFQTNLCLSPPEDSPYQPPGNPFGAKCLFEDHRAPNGTVFPYDTETVVVRITHFDAYPADAAQTQASPIRLGLLYHGADTRAYTEATLSDEEGPVRTWVIGAKSLGDGPYATQSQWSFLLHGDNPVQAYRGEYRIEVFAQKGA